MYLSFNPRTRESATVGEKHYSYKNRVSIHALVRVRPYLLVLDEYHEVFQSTHS